MRIQKSIFQFYSMMATIFISFINCGDKGVYPISYQISDTPLTDIVSSLDGKTILVQTEDKKLIFLDPQTGQIHHFWRLREDKITLSFSDDGKVIYGLKTNMDSKNPKTTIFGWDESNGTELFRWFVEGDLEVVGDRLFINKEKIFSIRAISTNQDLFSMLNVNNGYPIDKQGKYFVTLPSDNSGLKQIWNGTTYIKVFEDATYWPVADSVDGRFLLFYQNVDQMTHPDHSGLFVWDLQDHQFRPPLLLPFSAEKEGPIARSFSKDGSRIVAATFLDKHLFYLVWDVTSGNLLASIKAKQLDEELSFLLNTVWFLGDRNDRIFTYAGLSANRIWNTETGDVIETLVVNQSLGTDLFYTSEHFTLPPDGSWYIGLSARPGELFFWDFKGI